MSTQLTQDPLGSHLFKFFTRDLGVIERHEDVLSMLWPAVSNYRKTGRFGMRIVVCPQYSDDYRQVLDGMSVTAKRALCLFKYLKAILGRQISYVGNVKFGIALFDREFRQFEHMGVSVEQAKDLMARSVDSIGRAIRKAGTLPQSFCAHKLVGDEYEADWLRIFDAANAGIGNEGLGPHAPFLPLPHVLATMTDSYRRWLGTDDKEAHAKMFYREEAPCYLTAGHFIRKVYGEHTILVDVGSNKNLAALTRWQPEGEKLVDEPALLRVKNPSELDE